MFNEYENSNFYHNQFSEEENLLPQVEKKNGVFGNLRSFELNEETIILIAIIAFCLYDDFDMELIIIIAALYFLGI